MNKFKIQSSKFKVALVLALVLLAAGFFRFYQLGSVPPSPSLDEVSIGWNAYSLLKTGRDEYGYRWPILLRAYDDWRPALYLYFVIPFVELLGLSATAVRLPSVLLSLVTILTTYFLARELFKNSLLITHYSLLITLLLSISPWHIYLSRLGHEVNAGLTFSVLAIFLFLKSISNKKPTLFFMSAVFFALSFYTYQSQKLFLPLMIIVLGFIFRKRLLRRKKETVLAALLGLILLIPILKSSLSPGALMRFQGASIFSAQEEINQKAALRVLRDYQQNNILGLIFDNRRVAVSLRVLRSYLSHFDPGWLFFNGGEEKHKIPGLGLFYLWELPLLLIGAYQLIRNKFPREMKWLIFSWLLLAPLPATITSEAPHAMRVFNVLPIPQILTTIGLVTIGKKLTKSTSDGGRLIPTEASGEAMTPPRWKIKGEVYVLIVFLFLASLGYLYHNYFVNFPHEQSGSFQYALSQVIPDVLSVKDNYQKIVFSNEEYCRQSYMFWLFFSRYDPFDYLKQGGTSSGGFAEAHVFDKYEFRPIDWKKEKKEPGVLYIGNANDFGQKVLVLKTFENLDGQAVVRMVEPLIIVD